jgi:trehalose utilization protein
MDGQAQGGSSPRVVVWNEFRHERRDERVRDLYPRGMHAAIAAALAEQVAGPQVATATLDEPEHGLPEERLAATDVLLWWGHMWHDEVDDAVALRVQRHVLTGMGLVVLHSAHLSKPFRLLMGTSCNLRWREGDEREVLWTIEPGHPIARGVPSPLALGRQEMYGERFDIPAPDELVFVSSFSGGEVFRSGCCFRRGGGRVFYFSPGHEAYPTYHRPEIQQILANAVRWAGPSGARPGGQEESPHSPDGWWEGEPTA